MPIILGLLLLVVALWIFFWFAFSLIHLVLMLIVAGIVGWVADALVPGRLPWGWLGAILAGLVGSWLGVALLGHVGPSLFGVPIIPGLVGAVILAVLVELVGKMLARPSTV
ncbi:MAG TPA: GlsB/YeaQ/YmgE family stress response membrane protein [Chloroflexota bacterium]|nr:GlsB/YeaQ/YmgE family stress response membrane protein [Chloroflexota bacterium]